jgi:hypothetical protein
MIERASHEWSRRRPDERYSSIAALHAAAVSSRDAARTSSIDDDDLRVGQTGDADLFLIGRGERRASMTNWSFNQVSRKAGAPSHFVSQLPARLAADVLNDRLAQRKKERKQADETSASSLLFRETEGKALILRCLTTDSYTRIWNADVTSRLVELEKEGTWRPAPKAFDGSRGLYLGDRDMFAFMVDSDRRIFEKAPGGGLSRGFFCWNSEVGARTFGIMSFLYEFICGNHRVWGAKQIAEFKIKHIGNADERGFEQFAAMLTKYGEGSAKEDEAKITLARNFTLGTNKEEVLDRVFGLKIPDLAQMTIEAGYDKAVEHEDWYGSPRSVWGLAGGLTEIARDLPCADDRDRLDRAAAKVMAIAF